MASAPHLQGSCCSLPSLTALSHDNVGFPRLKGCAAAKLAWKQVTRNQRGTEITTNSISQFVLLCPVQLLHLQIPREECPSRVQPLIRHIAYGAPQMAFAMAISKEVNTKTPTAPRPNSQKLIDFLVQPFVFSNHSSHSGELPDTRKEYCPLHKATACDGKVEAKWMAQGWRTRLQP